METILKPGFDKILSIFYTDKSASVHLRDIARRTSLNENSAFRFLKKLEKQGILISKWDANLKKYGIVKSDISYSIFAYFDMLRLMQLPSIRRNAIAYFMDVLKDKPICVIIFGSTAKKTYSDNSDIDLLLIVNSILKTDKAEAYADSQTGLKINVIQVTYDDFKKELKLKNDKVVASAVNTGYPVTNNIEYYRWILNEGV